jgi:NAD(P)-dependent dehydrogenase (short-subunit alcohol dehydrogenase family)
VRAASAPRAAALGGLAVACDLRQADAIDALIAAIRQRDGRIGVCFSDAGIAAGGDVQKVPVRVWQP